MPIRGDGGMSQRERRGGVGGRAAGPADDGGGVGVGAAAGTRVER